MVTVWIVKGAASGLLDDGVPAGALEWQFSDGPPGERGSSADYYDLAEGLAFHIAEGETFNTDYAEFTQAQQGLFNRMVGGRARASPT